MNNPTVEADTRQRLLEAAGEVFAAQGFRQATVREICQRAGANIAAVNYHFGGKDELYAAVLEYAGAEALRRYPVGAGVEPGATAEARLGAFISNYLDRLLDPGRPAWHGILVSREMVEPTAVLDRLVASFVRPQWERLTGIVRELLGPGASDELVQRCGCSVIGQCLFYKHARPVLDRVLTHSPYTNEQRAALARHITLFALAGIAAARGQAGGRA
jgi:AcrR family transcriptional regulator